MWIDESYHEGSRGGVYVLAGVVDDHRDIRSLTALAGHRSFLHWADRAQRPETVAAINQIRPSMSLWIASSVGRRQQETARRLCLGALLADAAPDVTLRIEGRRDQQDERDRQTIRNADRSKTRSTDFTFVGKAASPLLWIADAGAGMASSYFASAKGSDHWWRSLRPRRLMIVHVA